MANETERPIHCRLEAEAPVTVGRPVNLWFTLENAGARRLWVLRWYTPLEGLRGRILRVMRGDEKIPYLGPMVKRGDPASEDYAVIEAGQSVSACVDLTTAYDLGRPGDYVILFASELQDVALDESFIPRKPDKFRGMAITCPPVRLTITPED